MLDIKDGTLRLPNGLALSPDTPLEPAALTGFKDKGDMYGLRVLFADGFDIWDRKFAMALRFEGGRLHYIEFIWKDGPVERLGYDATEKDLLGEKKQLVKMLTKHLGTGPTDTSLGVDYFPFPWGLVTARADLKSTMCSIMIDYFYRAP